MYGGGGLLAVRFSRAVWYLTACNLTKGNKIKGLKKLQWVIVNSERKSPLQIPRDVKLLQQSYSKNETKSQGCIDTE